MINTVNKRIIFQAFWRKAPLSLPLRCVEHNIKIVWFYPKTWDLYNNRAGVSNTLVSSKITSFRNRPPPCLDLWSGPKMIFKILKKGWGWQLLLKQYLPLSTFFYRSEIWNSCSLWKVLNWKCNFRTPPRCFKTRKIQFSFYV